MTTYDAGKDRFVLKPKISVRVTALLVASPLLVIGVLSYSGTADLIPCAVIVLLGGFFWQFIDSVRIVLDEKSLMGKRFGFTLWSVSRQDVLLKEGLSGDLGGFQTLLVYEGRSGVRMGSIPYIQFDSRDIDRLKSLLSVKLNSGA